MKTLFLDIETTGLPPKGSNYEKDFLQFPFIVCMGWKIGDGETKSIAINQEGRKIPEESIKIHGITNDIAEGSSHTFTSALNELFKDCLAQLPELQNSIDKVVGHNLYFDTSIIKANVLRLNSTTIYAGITSLLHKEKRIDTMQKTAKFMGGWKSLSELYFKLFGEKFEAHSNNDDVEAVSRCYYELIRIGILK